MYRQAERRRETSEIDDRPTATTTTAARPVLRRASTRSHAPPAKLATHDDHAAAPDDEAVGGDARPQTAAAKAMFGMAVNAGIHESGHGGWGEAESALARAATGPSASLPEALRSRFEGAVGGDLGRVHIHTDGDAASAAAAFGALAFAHGEHVYFGAGQYRPGTPDGDHLIAHEVAHTIQQRGVSSDPRCKLEVSEPGDALEQDADRLADAMVVGTQRVTGGLTPTRALSRRVSRQVVPPQQAGPAAAAAPAPAAVRPPPTEDARIARENFGESQQFFQTIAHRPTDQTRLREYSGLLIALGSLGAGLEIIGRVYTSSGLARQAAAEAADMVATGRAGMMEQNMIRGQALEGSAERGLGRGFSRAGRIVMEGTALAGAALFLSDFLHPTNNSSGASMNEHYAANPIAMMGMTPTAAFRWIDQWADVAMSVRRLATEVRRVRQRATQIMQQG